MRLPSEITEADVTAQLDRARRAVAAISAMLDPGAGARLTNPSAESVAFARALLSAFTEAGYGRSPQAAAAVVVNTFKKLREQAAAPDVGSSPVRELNGK